MKIGNCAIVVSMSLLLIAGCGHDEASGPLPAYASDAANWSKSSEQGMSGLGGMGSMPKKEAGKNADNSDAIPDEMANATPSNRKVIFNSKIEILVDRFSGIESKVASLVDRHGGFISEANVSHQARKIRSGHWTIRVPVTAYRQLIDSVGSLGEQKSRKENADDVTAEFYDLEARIKNKKLLEARIAKLLDEADSELRKMIEVEHELSRVREEIERMQGRLRFLTDVTGMSTLHLRIIERAKEPAPVVAATFSARISNAWNSALAQATNTVQNIAVTLVQNVFHIIVAMVMLAIAWLAARIIIRRVNRRQTIPA